MKKLYDEIMAMRYEDPQHKYGYDAAYNKGLEQAAELAKKYDYEIERLTKELNMWIDGYENY